MSEMSIAAMQPEATTRRIPKELTQRPQAASIETVQAQAAQLKDIQVQTAALLEAMDIRYVPSGEEPRYSGYHLAAAVLSTFDPTTLRPAGDPAKSSHEDLKALIEECVPTGSGDPQRYALRPEARRKVLKQIGTRSDMLQALEANPDHPGGADQEMFERYIRGDAPPLAEQNVPELAGTFQVVQWLEGIVDGLPMQDEVQQRWEEEDLLGPFRMLAGSKFRGRSKELRWLHNYVFDPAPAKGSKPPLVIWGPGGVGKSALIAHFIERLVARPAGERIPWAYLDFDRPGLDATEPLTLLVESVRQLAAQYPKGRQSIEIFGRGLQEMLLNSVKRRQETRSPDAAEPGIGPETRTAELDSSLRSLASLLDLLTMPEAPLADDGSLTEPGVDERLKQREIQESQTTAPDAGQATTSVRPFLVVLDTFEEVQYRSQAEVDRLFEFLAALGRWVPQVRPMMAGRNEVHTNWTKVENRKLGNFELQTARALLVVGGMPRDLAGRIVQKVGGNPLSLRLIIDLWRRGLADEGLSDLKFDQEADLEFEIQEAQIQGMLFARILEHIHDPEVQRLAHPGLVLRRVTPDLIQKVLAKPCGLRVKNLAQAEKLFDLLAREEALVTVDMDRRVLRHRTDVRSIMVRLLRDKDPDQVRAIETAAVSYYNKRNSPEDRAEEIYHRLTLKQSLDLVSQRWADAQKRGWTPQMREPLARARDELEPRQRAWLAAKLDLEFSPEDEKEADHADWEERTRREVQRHLDYDYPRKALEKLAMRSNWLPGSALYLLAAQAHEQLGEVAKAQEYLQQGYRSAARKGDRALALELRMRAVRLDLKLDDTKAAARRLDSAQKLVETSTRSAMSLIEIDLCRRVVARAAGDAKAAESAAASVLKRAEKVPDKDLARDPALAAWLAAEMGAEQTPLMVRVLRLIGPGQMSPDAVETLAVALAGWPVASSVQLGEQASALARAIISVKLGSPPSQIWRAYLRSAKPEESGRDLASLIEQVKEVPAEVLNALVGIMRQRAGKRDISQASLAGMKGEPEASTQHLVGIPPPPVTRTGTTDRPSGGPIRLTGSQFDAFHSALVKAFDYRGLTEMVRFRLDRNLETITLSNNLSEAAFGLIDWASRQGLILQLLDAARSARLDNPELAALADQLGLGLSGEQGQLERIVAVTGDLVDPLTWRSRLARLEPQVCRVEIRSQMMGTGFLVGPSIVVTAYHVVEDVIRGTVPSTDVSLRFDYRVSPDGITVNPGKVFGLEKDWLVDASPYSRADFDPQTGGLSGIDELGYAVMRAASRPGYTGVGSNALESTAELRDWVKLPTAPPMLEQGAPLFVLHHPLGKPLKLAMGTDAILGVNSNGTRVRYRLNTEVGSSGAPCFDGFWTLCALHLGSNGRVSFGTPIQAILDLLRQRGLADVLGGEER